MHGTCKYSKHSSIIWQVWLNVWVFIYGIGGCGFASGWCHLNFRYGASFEPGISWYSGKQYSVDSFWMSYVKW